MKMMLEDDEDDVEFPLSSSVVEVTSREFTLTFKSWYMRVFLCVCVCMCVVCVLTYC